MIGSCRAVDRGDTAAYDFTLCGEKDAAGGQRVYNGTIDAGALEGDWRPVYAAAVCGNRRFEFTSADADVVGTEHGPVVLGPGMKLDAVWTYGGTKSPRYELRFKVYEGCTLLVAVNGEAPVAFTASGTEQTYTFKNNLASNSIQFSAVGSGVGDVAEILSCSRWTGVAISFR